MKTMRSWRRSLVASWMTWALQGCYPKPGSSPESVLSQPGANGATSWGSLSQTRLAATDPRVGVMGRVVVGADSRLEFGFPGVTARVCFVGVRLWVTGASNQGRSHLAAVHEGVAVREVVLPKTQGELLLWEAPAGSPVGEQCVDVVHLTETWIGQVALSSFRIEGDALPAKPFPQRKLLFIGDSVTCGEAVRRKPECSKDETWWDANESYGALAARSLDAQFQLVCFGGKGVFRDWQGKTDVLNAPEFFPLAIPDERKLPYAFGSYVPDGVVISLGTNDFNPALGAFPNRSSFVERYLGLVSRVREAYPNAQLWLTEGAIVSDENLEVVTKGTSKNPAPAGQKATLRAYIEQVVALAKSSQVHYLPAVHYAADTCDAHPTHAEHEQMAKDVVGEIRSSLGW